MEEQSKSYEQRLTEAQPLVGFPGNQIEGDMALKGVALLCALTQAYRKKNPDVKPFQIICKVYGKPNSEGAREWYLKFSILCEMFLTPNAKFSTYGLTTVEDISREIKDIMEWWCPF